jgi:hypothetical protein
MIRHLRAAANCLLILAVAAFSPEAAADAAPAAGVAPTRVAVLGGRTTWGDVLVAGLSGAEGVTLVDRDQLDRVADEQTIRAALGGRADRGRLGAVVPADLLILVGPAGGAAAADPGAAVGVRLVVCDARLAVTLHDVIVPIRPATAGQPASRPAGDGVAAAVRDEGLAAVRRFAGGVRRVVAVPDFVSRDLTFDRAFLQSDYPELIRAACRREPGVAVVAVDEARAIAAERDASGVAGRERPTPVFVDGEYRTARAADGAVTVEMTVTASEGERVLADVRIGPVALEAAGPALRAAFAERLAALTGGGGGVAGAGDPAAEFRALVERADRFAELAEYSRSAALREAALLLRPDADDQRVRLVQEYARRSRSLVEQTRWPAGAKAQADDPFFAGVIARSKADWARSLQHCEHLVRNRRLTRDAAGRLAADAVRSITGVRATASQALSDCEAVRKTFVREVMTRVPLLAPPAAGRPRAAAGQAVAPFGFATALFRCDGNFYDDADLDLLEDVLLRRLPSTGIAPDYQLNFFLRAAGARAAAEPRVYRFTPGRYEAFLDRLAGAGDRPQASVYGRYGKLTLRRYGTREAATADMLAEARAIAADAAKVGFDVREFDYYMTQIRDEAAWIASDLAPRPPPVAAVARPPAAPPAAPPVARLSLEPIPLVLAGPAGKEAKLEPGHRWRAPGGLGGLTHVAAVGPTVDALWGRGAVLLMRRPGDLEVVVADEKRSVADVVACGRYVWVSFDYDAGLEVLDPDGKSLARVGKDAGLPPADRFGTLVHPLGPGRVMMAGSFGTDGAGTRTWLAAVSFDGGKAKVDVFHEAPKAWDRGGDGWANRDPAMGFRPEVLVEHRTPGPGGRRLIYVGGRPGNPLVVDAETLKVSVYPAPSAFRAGTFPRREGPREAFASIDGTLWVAGSISDFQSYRLNEATGLFDVDRKRPGTHSGNDWAGTVARDGDWLYYGSGNWRRLNLRDGTEEVLLDNPRLLPGYGSGNRWLVTRSAHYGLVAFAGGTLYRVRVADDNPATRATDTGRTTRPASRAAGG